MARMKGERTNKAADVLMSAGLTMAVLSPIAAFLLGPAGLAIGLAGVALGATCMGTGLVLKGVALARGFNQVAKEGILAKEPDNYRHDNRSNAKRNAGKGSFTILNDDDVTYTNANNKANQQTKRSGFFNRGLAQFFKQKDKKATPLYEQELDVLPVRERTNTQPSPSPATPSADNSRPSFNRRFK